MTTPLWAKMAASFYNKDDETATAMGRENYFTLAAANMLEAIANEVDDPATIAYLLDQAHIARDTPRA